MLSVDQSTGKSQLAERDTGQRVGLLPRRPPTHPPTLDNNNLLQWSTKSLLVGCDGGDTVPILTVARGDRWRVKSGKVTTLSTEQSQEQPR